MLPARRGSARDPARDEIEIAVAVQCVEAHHAASHTTISKANLRRNRAALLDRGNYSLSRRVLEPAVALHERAGAEPLELGASLSYLGRSYAALGELEAALGAEPLARPCSSPSPASSTPLTLAIRASLESVRSRAPADTP